MGKSAKQTQAETTELSSKRSDNTKTIDSEKDADLVDNTQATEGASKPTSVAEAFDQYYLRQVTADFADDIEKLRSANDFKESSLPVLIQALKQGADGFTEDEKRRLVGQSQSLAEGR